MNKLFGFFIIVLVHVPFSGAYAQSCSELGLDEAVVHAGELTTTLRIANFRADVKYMSELAGELEGFLQSCSDADESLLAQVCDFNCHLQLGRFRLFLAADLPFLSSSGGITRNDTPMSPQDAQEAGRLGLQIVNRGLQFLARQQNGGDKEAGYRNFVRQLVSLNGLKIQLLMNTGDVWYQTLSEARVQHLNFLVGDALSAVPGTALDDQPSLSKAYTQYESAMWVLVETKMDIPGETTYDDLLADMQRIEYDLLSRLESVRKGHLFLNIDPYEFTTISFEDLEARLAQSQRSLKDIENRIENIVERWHAGKEGQATRSIDEARTIRSQQVNLIAHRIGKIEKDAQIFSNGVEQEIAAIAAESDTFNFRQQIRNLEISLATKMSEFENRRTLLEGRQELDLIVLSKEAELERRNELRWLLSFEMTQMNLDLQISSIETQISEYERQIARNQNQLDQLERRKGIVATQSENAVASIAESESQIVELQTRQTELFAAKRAVLREDICSLESQLAFIGEPTDNPFIPALAGEQACTLPESEFTRKKFDELMCGSNEELGFRQKLIDQNITARAFTMKCVVGEADFTELVPMVENSVLVDSGIDLPGELAAVDCGAFSTTETEFAEQIYNTESQLLSERASDLQEQIDSLSEALSSLIIWTNAFERTVTGAQIALGIAEVTLAIAGAIPNQTIHIAGMASGTSSEFDFSRSAGITVEVLRTTLSTIIKLGEFTQQNEREIRAIGEQLQQLQQAYDRIDTEKALKSVALHRTHFQLAGRRAEGLNDIKQLVLQNSLAGAECQNADLNIDEQVARLRADHRRLLASMDLQASENELLSFNIATQERLIARSRREISILGLESETLDLSTTQLTDDSGRVGELISAAGQRKQRVLQTQSSVNGLADESREVSNVINELRERQGQAMLALSEEELRFVEQRIESEQANTELLVENLTNAVGRINETSELRGQILEFQETVLQDVRAQQEEMTKLVSQIDEEGTGKKLFMATQEQLSELMKGIPEYIIGKRRNLETANRLLHLMRRRFETVQAITGDSGKIPTIYVRNASQLNALVEDISNNRFFNEEQINIDHAQVLIQANSGFVRKLALTGAVDFEVSPFADSEEAMIENGFLAVWDPLKFSNRRNMTLIDVFIGTNYKCLGDQWNRFTLTHTGSGSVFRPMTAGSTKAVPSIVVGPARSKQQTFINLVDNKPEVDNIIKYWLFDEFQFRQFPRPSLSGPPNDRTSALRYLGAPVIGTYKLRTQSSTCPFDDATFTINFIFAGDS